MLSVEESDMNLSKSEIAMPPTVGYNVDSKIGNEA